MVVACGSVINQSCRRMDRSRGVACFPLHSVRLPAHVPICTCVRLVSIWTDPSGRPCQYEKRDVAP